MSSIMKHQSCSSSKLSLHHDSRLISKSKPPKIRIIHIIAPEIINTDAANFRELVQALTGKPGENHVRCNKSPTLPIKKEEEEDGLAVVTTSASASGEEDDSSNDMWNEFVDLDGFISPHEFPPGFVWRLRN